MKPTGEMARMALLGWVQRYELNLPEVMPYLKERGITEETARRFRLGYTGDVPLADHPSLRLSIPCLTASHPVHLSFRAVEPWDSGPKYLHIAGATRMFNSRAIVEAGDEIHITEGQLDAVVLEQCGLHAVGVLGAKAWKSHHPRMFAGFSVIYVWADVDTPGEEFARKVCDGLPKARVVRIGGEVKDVNELYLSGGKDAIVAAYRDEAA